MTTKPLPYLKYRNGFLLVVMGIELTLTPRQARQFYQQLQGVSHG